MPENANRRAHLHSHAATGMRTAEWPDLHLAVAQHRHPDWPLCPAGCGWPVDPAAGTTHPGCTQTTAATVAAANQRRTT